MLLMNDTRWGLTCEGITVGLLISTMAFFLFFFMAICEKKY